MLFSVTGCRCHVLLTQSQMDLLSMVIDIKSFIEKSLARIQVLLVNH